MLIDAINETIDFKTSAFETTAEAGAMVTEPVKADCDESVVNATDHAYEPAVFPIENLHTLDPPARFTVDVAVQAPPTDGISVAFVIMDRPVNGVPFAIPLPYASRPVIVNSAISPGL